MKDLPDFASYFHALWGYQPFPWQSRLAADLEDAGYWPSWITLPTGMGKTAVLDVAIYDLARQAALPPGERTAPVRITFAVNRRIIVDEAYDRAKRISEKLRDALADEFHVLHPVAAALQKLSGLPDASPLKAYPLRGGTFTDHSWAKTPTQPVVLTTTLDQLGSRLLFRGYGVSEYARPVHAALLAYDSLLILDEAHTSKAFSQTLSSIASFREQATENISRPFHSVQLTATPPATAEAPFKLNEKDFEDKTVAKRFNASKPATLQTVDGAKGKNRHAKITDQITPLATTLNATHRRILIVVNRVATAEALFAKLRSKNAKEHDPAVHLLTGRIRPLDREKLIKDLSDLHGLKDTNPADNVPRLILIATQTIEVGADYDFDALLTELAPLDSLRQRFGRLNRQGRDISSEAIIFAPDETLDEKYEDPLYGKCLLPVWKWLHNNQAPDGRIDFGLGNMDSILPSPREIAPLLAPAPDAPILLAPHLDLLCQTSPEPHVSPAPALYIHGPGMDFPQVSVILRADLSVGGKPEDMIETAPPLGTEAATIPLHLVRSWLMNPEKAEDPGGDIPHTLEDEKPVKGKIKVTGAYTYRDKKAAKIKNINDVRNGDILVIDAATDLKLLQNLIPNLPQGGNWLLDDYETAYLTSRDRLRIRFHSGMIKHLTSQIIDAESRANFIQILSDLMAKDEDGSPTIFDEKKWREKIPEIASILSTGLPVSEPLKEVWVEAMGKNPDERRPKSDWNVSPYLGKDSAGVILTNRSRVGFTNWPLDPEDLGFQRITASEKVGLTPHSEAVSLRAEKNAHGLPVEIITALRNAGKWHDLGKLDPRFQALLHGCSPLIVPSEELAKSGGFRPFAVAKLLRKRSELPDGFRHELLSTLIVADSKIATAHPERNLLLHLIASHHGRCRAMAPVTQDKDPIAFEAQVDTETLSYPGDPSPLSHIASGVTARFWKLNRRFGWWGLAYLESLLRLADQCESANPTTPEQP